jgi:hypothetical protein
MEDKLIFFSNSKDNKIRMNLLIMMMNINRISYEIRNYKIT